MRIYSYCIIAFFLWLTLQVSSTGWAQSQVKVDSLRKVLEAKATVPQFEALNEFCWELVDINSAEALSCAKLYHQQALEYADTVHIIRSGRVLGRCLRANDKVDEAIGVLNKVLPLTRLPKYISYESLILNSLGGYFVFKADYAKALEYFLECVLIFDRDRDLKQFSVVCNNIGLTYYKLNNIDLALEYYQKSLKAKKDASYNLDLDRLLINIGLCYTIQGEFEKAFNSFRESFAVCSPSCTDVILLEREIGISNTFLRMKNIDSAKLHFTKSLDLARKISNQRFQAESLLALANISLAANEFVQAKNYLTRFDSVDLKDEYPELIADSYQIKADYLAKQGDFKQALMHHQRYSEAHEKIIGDEVHKNLLRIQMRLAERENLQRIEAQERMMALQLETVSQHRSLNRALAGLVLLAIGLIFTLYKINRQKQRINVVLDERVKERTKELEQNRDELRHLHEEKTVELKTLSDELRVFLASFEGLYSLAKKQESTGRADEYVDEMWRASKKLSHSVKA